MTALGSIDPIIVSLGPLTLHWYGLMLLMGFGAAILLARHQAYNSDGLWDQQQVAQLLFYVGLGAVIGGRLGYLIFYQFDYLLIAPALLWQLWLGGSSFHGGLCGAMLAICLFCVKNNRDFLSVCDFTAPLVPLGLVLERIGSLLARQFTGSHTELAWGLIAASDPLQLTRHPIQLYELILQGLVMFWLLQIISRKGDIQGLRFAVFLLGYGIFALFVGLFSVADTDVAWLIFSTQQLLSASMVILGAYIMHWSWLHQAKSAISAIDQGSRIRTLDQALAKSSKSTTK